MDADATSKLHKAGVLATDDSFKYIWFQVSHFYVRKFECWGRKKLGTEWQMDFS